MSRRSQHREAEAAAREQAARRRYPSALRIALCALIAALLTCFAGWYALGSRSFARGMLIRVLRPQQKGWREWVAAMQREIQAAPLGVGTQESLEAHRQTLRIAAALARGELDVAKAAEMAESWMPRDAENRLTRWIVAGIDAARLLGGGADPMSVWGNLRTALAVVPAPAYCTTYERVEAARSYAILSRKVERADVAVAFLPKDPEMAMSDALPWLMGFVESLAVNLARAGRAAEAHRCRVEAAEMLYGVLRDDPMPPTALLVAGQLERVARSLSGPATATRGGVMPAGSEDWASVVEGAHLFQTDVLAAFDRGSVDLLDRRPLSYTCSKLYHNVLTFNFGVLLLVVTGVGMVIAAFARAGLTALTRPAVAARATTSAAPHRDAAHQPPTISRRRVWLAAVAVAAPPMIGMFALGEYIEGRGPTYQLWPLAVVGAALLGSALVGHLLCGEFLLKRTIPAHPAMPAARSRIRLAAIGLGILLSIYPVFPPVLTSRAERGLHALWTMHLLWPLLVAVAVAVVILAWRGRRTARPVGARAAAALGASAWLVCSGLACGCCCLNSRVDGQYRSHIAADTNRIGAMIGDDWPAKYFDRMPDSPGFTVIRAPGGGYTPGAPMRR